MRVPIISSMRKKYLISQFCISAVTGQVFSQNLRNRLDLASSEAGPDSEDNSYLGYSLALGDFTGNGGSDLAVGMPRAANLTGKVRNHFCFALSSLTRYVVLNVLYIYLTKHI